jgi:WD40 repeat protein
VALGSGSQQLFSLAGDGTIRTRPGYPGPVRSFDGHTGPVRLAIFSPDGKYLVSCGGWPEGDKTVRLWNVKTGKQVRVLKTGEMQWESAAFSPDGKYVAAGEDTGVIHLLEVSTGKVARRIHAHEGSIPDLVFSRDGKWLLSTGKDKTICLWDVRTWEAVRIFRNGHTDCIRSAVFHPDGKRILSGGRDRTIAVWDLNTGKLLETITHTASAEKLAVLPDGKRFLVAGGRSMDLYDLGSGKVLRSYPGHEYGSTSLSLAKGGRLALSTGYDGSTRLWDVESGQEVNMVRGHGNWVNSVAFSPDGTTFATAGGGGSDRGRYVRGTDFAIRLWRVGPLATARLR